jgi:hypothetical protein
MGEKAQEREPVPRPSAARRCHASPQAHTAHMPATHAIPRSKFFHRRPPPLAGRGLPATHFNYNMIYYII